MEELQTRNHLHANNNGFTLVGVLMVLVVLSVLGLSILMITSNSVKLSAGERDDQSVFYVAEAGVVEQVYDINEDVKVAFGTVKTRYDNLSIKEKDVFDFIGQFYAEVVSKVDLSPKQISSFEPNFGNSPSALVTIVRKSINPPEYEIKSVGTIGNKARTVTQKVNVFLEPDLIDGPGISGNMALYVNNTIYLDGSTKIYGDAATRSKNPKDVIFLGTARVTGKLEYGANYSIGLTSLPTFPTYGIPSNQVYEKSQYEKTDVVKDGRLLINSYLTPKYTLNMGENMEFREILVDSGYTLIINVGTENREIVVDHLNVNQGFIQIIGSGKLTIHVKDKITMGGSSTINNNGDTNKLKVNYKGTTPIILGGAQKIFGSLHAEVANIEFTGGGGFYGNVSTGGTRVTVNGGAKANTQLFLAPNAKFTLAQGGHIRGLVIANSFIGTGGGSLTYDETNSGTGSGGSIKDYGDGTNLIRKTPLIEE